MSSKPANTVIKLKTITTSSTVAAAVSTNVENTLMTRGIMNVLCARYLYIFKVAVFTELHSAMQLKK